MQAVGLGVTPTPDDGIRRSTERVWDESARPSAPPAAPMAYTESQRASGQHLVDVHDHFRSELATILDLVEQVARGTRDPGGARSAIHAMTLRQNNWTVGAYCSSYCRLLTTHQGKEDRYTDQRRDRADRKLPWGEHRACNRIGDDERENGTGKQEGHGGYEIGEDQLD